MTFDLIAISGLLYLAAMVFYTAYLFFKTKWVGKAATGIFLLGAFAHLVAFLIRWEEFYMMNGGGFFKSVPITNLYESLQFFALLLAVIYLVFEYRSKSLIIGGFAAAISGATVLFIDAIGASSGMAPLVPALQSNWLLAHVSLSFVAYVFFALSAISAFIYLVLVSKGRKDPAYIFWTVTASLATSGLFAVILDASVNFPEAWRSGVTSVKIMFAIFCLLAVLFFWYWGVWLKKAIAAFGTLPATFDDMAYKFAILGFTIFTIGGLIFGAIWAEQAWGRYWSWDPKETWAFITWAVYGLYIHGKVTGKWQGKLSNTLAVVGFMLTIFTYLGVNLFLSGLHSYGGL